jgi:aminopeptidase N
MDDRGRARLVSSPTNDDLTRDEARERAAKVANPVYEIALDLSGDGSTFRSETIVRFDAEAGAETFLDIDAAEIVSAELNGQPVPDPELTRLHLKGLDAHNELRVVAECRYLKTGTGLHLFTDPADKETYAYTQFEPFDAHRVFACFDQPDIKGTFAFRVRAPRGATVISNAPLAASDEQEFVFEPTKRISTYLTAICSGPWHTVTDHHRGIDLAWSCRTSLARYLDPDELFEITKQGFDFFQELFDQPYPFGKYDQVYCPECNFGAMENAGCVTFSESYLFRSRVTQAERESRAEVILHEMAHMWFGDLVTMRWWDDLWLNESFATYMAYLASERATRFSDAWVRFAVGEKAWAYDQDQLPTTHPIVADIPDVEATHLNFDGITYAKGASVLKQLVAWVGEEAFVRGLRVYFAEHAWGNTELADFLRPLAEASGRDLEDWSAQWLETSGVNTLRLDAASDSGTITSAAVLQDALPRPHRLGVGLYEEDGGEVVRRSGVMLDVTGERTEVADLVGRPVPTILLPNDGDHAYAKVRFDGRSFAEASAKLSALVDPLARAMCWSTFWDMVRDAELGARRYVSIAIEHTAPETHPPLLSDVLARAGSAIVAYADPSRRTATREAFAAAALRQLRSARAGSDPQLAWARTFAGAARTHAQTDVVLALLRGAEKIDGLEIDTELRWLFVKSLAAAGATDEDVIADELDRDRTDQGERHANHALAARPDPDAKAWAWSKITTDDNVTLAMLRALARGMMQPDQEPILEPYRDKYFEELVPIWNRRGLDFGLEFADELYPAVLVDQRTIERTDAALGDPALPAPLRRLLLEGRDGVLRAMKARARDASDG